MATTITAGNATNGTAIDSDNTGTIDIKTGPGTGTTAIAIDASQAVTMPGNLTVTGTITAGAGTPYVFNQYTSPATWTKPTGLKSIKVTVVGAGGSGGPILSNPVGVNGATGGGGGGGGAVYYAPAPSIPGPISITAGSGTNSFGALVSCTAGSNGATAPGSPSNPFTTGGAGGTGTISAPAPAGSFAISGGGGTSAASNLLSGMGAGGLFGLGAFGAARFTPSDGSGAGFAATGYGAGGGGAAKSGQTNAYSGGAGTPGIVIIEEFY